jgi:hypothetical protein
MNNYQAKSNQPLNEAFGYILSTENLIAPVKEIAELIRFDSLSKAGIDSILEDHRIADIEDLKEELLDLLLCYIRIVLKDYRITELERRNILFLKLYFKIREGDFFRYRESEVESILKEQFQKLYSDNKINEEEAIYNSQLQEIFDLGYDQFDIFKEDFVVNALDRGGDIMDMDTALNIDSVSSKTMEVRKKLLNSAFKSEEVKNKNQGLSR